MGGSLVKVTPMRNKLVSVFSSPSSMRLRISLSSVRTHLSQAAAVSDAFSSGGNELRMASSTGCAEEKETNCGVCASAWQNVREQKRNKQSVLPSLLGIGVNTGCAPGRKSAGVSLPPAHNTVASSQLPVADRSLPTIAAACEFGSSCFLGSGLSFS